MARRTECPVGFRRHVGGVVFDGGAVGLLDRTEPGGYPGLAGGDGLAV
jgi:hypothetical protein